jgi:hypothetical protein
MTQAEVNDAVRSDAEKQALANGTPLKDVKIFCSICWQEVPYFEYYNQHINSHPCE